MRRRLHWKPNSTTNAEIDPQNKQNLLQPRFVIPVLAGVSLIILLLGIDPGPIAAFLVILLISGIVYAVGQSFRKADALRQAEDEKRQLKSLKRFKIGDDGQIVELKKPRKRSKNPHQR